MASSGETHGRNFIGTCIERECFNSEPLFHFQTSQSCPSDFPFYDESLHMHSDTFDSPECVNTSEKLGPISSVGYKNRKETDQAHNTRHLFPNSIDAVGSILDHRNNCDSLPLRCSDELTNRLSSEDSCYDDKFDTQLKYNGIWNLKKCDQTPKTVPSSENVRCPRDTFMISDQFQCPHQGTSPRMANVKENTYVDDLNWSSFAIIDPLHRLSGYGGEEVTHHSRTGGVRLTQETKVEEKFKVSSGNDKLSIKLPEGLNCKTSTMFHGYEQAVPSNLIFNDCTSAVGSSINSTQDVGCTAEKQNDAKVLNAASDEASCDVSINISASLENSSKISSVDVNVNNPKDSGREFPTRSSCKRTEPNKKQPTELFFDPRRIFSTPLKQKPQRACSRPAKHVVKTPASAQNSGNEKYPESANVRKDSPEISASCTEQNDGSILNNKSPLQPHSGQSFDHGQFIRNDLSGARNSKNSGTRVDHGSVSQHQNNDHPQERCESSRTCETIQGDVNGDESSCRKVENESVHDVKVTTKIDKGKILSLVAWALYETSLILVSLMKLVVGIILHEAFSLSYYICWLVWLVMKWLFSKLKGVLLQNGNGANEGERRHWYHAAQDNGLRKSRFLSENISLPESGDEAIRRLFSCEGKDPYSILGLKSDCTDEEIRKYYRRQAVLVHPDKNREPGAEEAFKILNHAFELIGEPEKRHTYDAQATLEQEDDTARQQFSDLLTKLHETMQEAMQYMGCSVCGGKHKRTPVEILQNEARYCSQCNIHHSAKEGDVWAESSAFGFKWHYYACMEGHIYDVTEWASCQGEKFRNVSANSHFVQIHISTGRNRHQRMNARDVESELKDLFNSMYGAAGRGGTPAAGPFGKGAYSPDSASAGSGSGAKRRRRRRR